MFKNYFRTSIRNLWKNRTYGFMNIFGLAIGIACAALIFLWVEDELTYDHYFKNRNNLYKVKDRQTYDGTTFTFDATPGPLAQGMKAEIPGIKNTARSTENTLLFSLGDKSIYEHGNYVDSNLFPMLQLSFIKGKAANAFRQLHSVVISKKMAEKFFGSTDVIDKTLKVNNQHEYVVTGVIQDLPENVSFKFDWLAPFQIYENENSWVKQWGNNGITTYVEVRPNANISSLNKQLYGYIQTKEQTAVAKLSIYPMKKWRLYDNYVNGVEEGGRIKYVKLFSTIAWIILIIACINFMNLAIARSAKRAKEVGVRKVVGAMRDLLFRQFLLEAILTVFLAVIISIVLVLLLLPLFNQLTEKSLSLHITEPSLLINLFLLTVITGFIAGSYPALFLSSLNPITVLKGALKFRSSNSLFGKGLVVFQFTLSIALIIFTVVVYKQMNFIQTKNLGLDRSNLIYIPLEGDLVKNYQSFKNEALASGHIESVSFSGPEPTNVGWWSPGMQWQGKDPEDKTLFAQIEIGHDFLKTMKIPLIDGRDFSPSFPTDSSNFIINEAAAKYMKIKNPVGASFSHGNTKGKIIGLIKDYNFQSLHQPIAPAFINLASAPEEGTAIIRTLPGKTKQTLATIESLTKKFNPKYPFSYVFVDDKLNGEYGRELIVGQMSYSFAFLAVFISCMGLFGLSMFMAEQRNKEIGIRKIVGASVSRIVALLSKDFIVLVIIALLIASPIAWWAMTRWLQNFEYKTDIGWTVFAFAGFAAIAIALATISFQAIKAAIANPVKSLRTE